MDLFQRLGRQIDDVGKARCLLTVDQDNRRRIVAADMCGKFIDNIAHGIEPESLDIGLVEFVARRHPLDRTVFALAKNNDLAQRPCN